MFVVSLVFERFGRNEYMMPVTNEQGEPLVQETADRARAQLSQAVRNGKLVSEEAAAACLDDFSWLWEESITYRPSYVGVRGSFLLANFYTLASVYAPAADYLRCHANMLTQQVQDGCATLEGMQDLAKLNQRHQQDADTLEAMQLLIEQQPELAQSVGQSLWMVWVRTQQWDWFGRFPPSFEVITSILRETCARTHPSVRQMARAQPGLFQAMANQNGFPSFDEIVTAYRATGQDEQVQYLLDEEAQLRVF